MFPETEPTIPRISGVLTPLQDDTVSPGISRSNSRRIRHGPYDGDPNPDEASGSPASEKLQEKLASTVWAQLNRFREGLLAIFNVTRAEGREIIDQGYSLVPGEAHQLRNETMRRPNYTADLYRDAQQKFVSACPCWNDRAGVSKSLANTHLSIFPGFSIFIDISCLREKTRHDRPCLTAMDSFSRFTTCAQIHSIRPEQLIDTMGRRWVAFVGIPRYAIRGGCPGFVGSARNTFSSVFNVTLMTSPPREAEQMGALERHVGLLGTAISSIGPADVVLPFREVARQACVAKNHAPAISCGYSPVRIVFGRGDYSPSIAHGQLSSAVDMNSEEGRRRRRLITLTNARLAVMSSDATKTVERCSNKTLRIGPSKYIPVGAPINVLGGKNGLQDVGRLAEFILMSRREETMSFAKCPGYLFGALQNLSKMSSKMAKPNPLIMMTFPSVEPLANRMARINAALCLLGQYTMRWIRWVISLRFVRGEYTTTRILFRIENLSLIHSGQISVTDLLKNRVSPPT